MTKNATAGAEVSDFEVVAMMLVFGGSFIVKLAQAWQAADPVNRARVRAAFEDYWTEYRQIAIERANHA